MKEMNLFSACGILGYGFPYQSLVEGLRRSPDLTGCDAGSTDPGPYYLGSGQPFVSKESCKRDTRLLLTTAIRKEIPFIVGSAGGGGGQDGLNWQKEIVLEIAREENLHFRLATINADIDKKYHKKKILKGKVHALS